MLVIAHLVSITDNTKHFPVPTTSIILVLCEYLNALKPFITKLLQKKENSWKRYNEEAFCFGGKSLRVYPHRAKAKAIIAFDFAWSGYICTDQCSHSK